jgi:protein-tyrosine phosphatase
MGYACGMPDIEPPHSIVLDGASNVRDIGGYRTENGKRVRRGLVYRSAALAKLTEADLAVIHALGLRTICDFRGVEESGRAPTIIRDVPIVALPIEPTVGAGLRDILATKEATGEALFAVLERAYAAYALSSNAQYQRLFGLLLEGGTPLLFHCSAGKDRTGFGAAMLLTALGVSWDVVVADFEATNALWRRDTVQNDDLPTHVRESLLRANPLLLTAAFDAARRQYGSIDTYLAEALLLGPTQKARLRELLLEE